MGQYTCNPRKKKKVCQNPEEPFLDQFFALIPNLVSDLRSEHVQYMILLVKVGLLCMGLDPTDNPRTIIWCIPIKIYGCTAPRGAPRDVHARTRASEKLGAQVKILIHGFPQEFNSEGNPCVRFSIWVTQFERETRSG